MLYCVYMGTESYKEAVKAIDDTLFTPDVHGNTRFAREVHDAVFNDDGVGRESRFQRELKKAFYGTIGRWLIGGGMVLIFALAGIYFQVETNSKALEEGGRYTEADALKDLRLQESRDARQDEDIQNLRLEINGKLDTILDRLYP